MREQFFVEFDKPVDPSQISLVLRSSGVLASDVEWLDPQRREQYLPFLAPVRSKATGLLQSLVICVVTTTFGLMSVIVENVGYVLSLSAVGVLLATMWRKTTREAAQVLSVRVDASEAQAAKSSLVRFGAVAVLGPVS